MGWISVDKRLPKKLEKVLFHWLLNGHGKNISMGYMCDAGWNIYLPYKSFGLNADLCHVTHWRHLPDFPKFNPPVRQVGSIIIDDPLAQTPISESVESGTLAARKFAEKLVDEHKELFKRLADK